MTACTCIRIYKPPQATECTGKPIPFSHYLHLTSSFLIQHLTRGRNPVNLPWSAAGIRAASQISFPSQPHFFWFPSLDLNVESYPICRQPLALLLGQWDDEYISISSLWLWLKGPVPWARISVLLHIQRDPSYTSFLPVHAHFNHFRFTSRMQMTGVTALCALPRKTQRSCSSCEKSEKWKKAGISLFSPNPVTYESNMRNGTKMRTIQLGQNVYARSDIWESSRKKLFCVQLQLGSLMHLHMQIWPCMCLLCTAVHLLNGILKTHTAIFRLKWPKAVLVCSICMSNIFSRLQKKYNYSAFWPQLNSCCGWKASEAAFRPS